MSNDYLKLKESALSLLARREHAIEELRLKLMRKSDNSDDIARVLDELIADNYLNQSRYVEMMIRSRFNRGHGPLRIKQEIRQFQVSDTLVSESFDAFGGDWFDLARQVREKKFGAWEGGDYKLRAKQMRFLASRGFSPNHIEAAFSGEPD